MLPTQSIRTRLNLSLSVRTVSLQPVYAHRNTNNPRINKEITLDSLYDPSRLPDFDPTFVHLKTAKLVQQPLYSTQKKLIPSWLVQEELRPGTFINVEAKLNVHHFSVFSKPSSVRLQYLFSTSHLMRPHPSTDLSNRCYPS